MFESLSVMLTELRMTALTATQSIKEMVSSVVRESLDPSVGSRLDSAA